MNYFYDEEDDDEDDEEVVDNNDSTSTNDFDFSDDEEDSDTDNSDGDNGSEDSDEDNDGSDDNPTDDDDSDDDSNDDKNNDDKNNDDNNKDDNNNKDNNNNENNNNKDNNNNSDNNNTNNNNDVSNQDSSNKKGKSDNSGNGNNSGKGNSQSNPKGNKPGAQGANNPTAKGGQEAAKKGGEEAAKKAGEEVTKKAAQETAKKAAANTAAKAGAQAAASSAAGAAAAAPLAYILFWVIVVIVCIIIIVGIIMFILTAPGMLTEKLGKLFRDIGKRLASYFGADSTEQIDQAEINEVLDYLEEMGYDLKGYGFLTDDVESGEDNDDYDYKQGVIRDPDTGGIKEANSDIIFTYLASDNYVYTVKNFNPEGTAQTWFAIADVLGVLINPVYGTYRLLGGDTLHDETDLGRGLLSIYIYDSSDGSYKDYSHSFLKSLFGWNVDWDLIDIDMDDNSLTIRRGWGANTMKYYLDGWTGRYGMPLEFLLSVHIATMKPDLAYEMATTFETDVRILMEDASGDNSMTAAYKKDFIENPRKTDIEDYILYDEIEAIKSEGWSPFDGWTLSKEEALDIIALGIESADNCTYLAPTFKLLDASDNGNGGIFDNDYKKKLESYGITDSEFEAVESDLLDQIAEGTDQEFKVEEAMLERTDEESNGTKKESAESYGYDYQTVNSNGGYIIEDCGWIEGAGSEEEKECDGKSHQKNKGGSEGWKPCGHTYKNKGATLKYYIEGTTDNSSYHAKKSIVHREWEGTVEGVEGTTTYQWITYVYRVYKFPEKEREEGKGTYETSFMFDYILRDLTHQELIDAEVLNPDGTPKEEKRCSDVAKNGTDVVEKACENCRRHVKTIISNLSDTQDANFDTYVPHIERVTGHWFRDVYFMLTEEEASTIKLSRVDTEYEKNTGERWTEYEKNTSTGEDQLYYYDEDVDDRIGEPYNGTLKEAQEQGIKVLRKPKETYAVDFEEEGLISWNENEDDDGWRWSAYEYGPTESEWTRAFTDEILDEDDDLTEEEKEVKKRVYYMKTMEKDVIQKQDALRGVTNPTIKDMFLDRNYFSYDGTTETAEIIQGLRKSIAESIEEEDVDTIYGSIPESYLNKKYNIEVTKTQIDDEGNESFETVEMKDVKVKDYVSQVEITIDSLGAFSILENTHTLDADFIYKDFKELIVELGYFNKEELSDSIPRLLQFLVPTVPTTEGYPIRMIDKNENEYGTFIHSKLDYEAAEREAIANIVEEANATRDQMKNGLAEDLEEKRAAEGSVNSEFDTNIPSSSATTSGIEESSGQGKKTHDITVNGITYEAYWQKPVQCTLYAYAFIAQAYGDKTVEQLVTNSPYWSDSQGFYWNAFSGSGVPGNRITGDNKNSMYENTLQALSEGKPVMLYSSLNSTGGYHAVVLLGVDSNGQILYYDPWPIDNVSCSLGKYGDTSKTASENLKTLISTQVLYSNHCVFIPNNPPPGTALSETNSNIASLNTSIFSTFALEDDEEAIPVLDESRYCGFEGGEAVVSPVTGILLEYGVYDDNDVAKGYRMNVDKQGAVDKVGYAKILVLNDEINNQVKELYSNSLPEELQGLDVFATDYNNAHIGGFIIYIDGFKCEMPEETGTTINLEYFKGKAATVSNGAFVSGDSNIKALYEPDVRYKSSNEALQATKDKQREDKTNLVPLYKFNATVNGKTEEVLLIKEGTVIGTTYSNEELATKVRGETYNKDEIQGNYLRIIMRNNDDEVVENVEDYMKLDGTGINAAFDLDDEKFLYWLGVYLEGGDLKEKDGKWYSEPVYLNDGAGATHFFGITKGVQATIEAQGYSVDDLNSDMPIEDLIDIYLALTEVDKEYVKSQLGEDIPDGYLQAFISVKHNYGNLTKRGDEYKVRKSVSEKTWTTYEGSGEYATGLTNRRIGEWKIITEGKYLACYDGNTEIEFDTETPFSDWCAEHGVDM